MGDVLSSGGGDHGQVRPPYKVKRLYGVDSHSR